MNRHTPGPWRYSELSGNIRDMAANILAGVGSHPRSIAESADANGRLMAAAPDLLEACERMLGMFGFTSDGQPAAFCGGEFTPPPVTLSDDEVAVVLAVMAAIAKAKGEEAADGSA